MMQIKFVANARNGNVVSGAKAQATKRPGTLLYKHAGCELDRHG